ncbi:MAG TPA: glycosyltransferase family 2 protein, partial [Patescibacteria group bacterium]
MRRNKKSIMYSVVVCTYNREKFIKECLRTLTNLDFPKNKFEIIVVDDGSTDNTINIVKKFPVKLIQHSQNKGIGAARNTGLANAKGDVYICFDDDCNVSKDWLKNLALAYEKFDKNKVAGIAGIIELKDKGGLIEKYVYETGYGNPSPTHYTKTTNIFSRFFSYLKHMFLPSLETNKKFFEVGEIWGANCSFPVEVLKEVNGWDQNLSGVEDTDLCDRIKKKFPTKKFMCTKDAVLYHDHKLSLKNFLLKPYSRGVAIFNFYEKKEKAQPIFPFPILIILLSALLTFINPLSVIFSLLLLPQLFYIWWGLKFITKRKAYYLLFPYLQAGYELFSVL